MNYNNLKDSPNNVSRKCSSVARVLVSRQPLNAAGTCLPETTRLKYSNLHGLWILVSKFSFWREWAAEQIYVSYYKPTFPYIGKISKPKFRRILTCLGRNMVWYLFNWRRLLLRKYWTPVLGICGLSGYFSISPISPTSESVHLCIAAKPLPCSLLFYFF